MTTTDRVFLQIISSCLFLSLTVALSGCGESPNQPSQSDSEAAERNLAEAQLSKAKLEREQANQRALQEERRRLEMERPEHKYPQAQLQAAARPRSWAGITVPDLNIKAVFNSTWTDGNLNYRVAFLGERAALDHFLTHHTSYSVHFADPSGNNIFEFEVKPSDFVFDPPSVNDGIPTAETRGSVPCDLPLYEQSVQWNLHWMQ